MGKEEAAADPGRPGSARRCRLARLGGRLVRQKFTSLPVLLITVGTVSTAIFHRLLARCGRTVQSFGTYCSGAGECKFVATLAVSERIHDLGGVLSGIFRYH